MITVDGKQYYNVRRTPDTSHRNLLTYSWEGEFHHLFFIPGYEREALNFVADTTEGPIPTNFKFWKEYHANT